MSSAPVIVAYRPEHRASLVALWKAHFGAWSAGRLEQRWSWQFEENPFRADRCPEIVIGEHEGRVVGHVSGVPVPLWCDGKRQVALATSGLVVDEQHRYIGMRLMRAVQKTPPILGRTEHPSTRKLFDAAGAPTLEQSSVRFTYPIRYSGWLARSLRRRAPVALHRVVTPGLLEPIGARWNPKHRPAVKKLPKRAGGAAGADIVRLESFGPEYDELWEAARRQWQCSLLKDRTYMNWRYIACPTLHAIVLGLKGEGGTLRAVAVGVQWGQPDTTPHPCGTLGEITEFIARDPTDPGLSSLCEAMLHELNGRRVDAVESSCLHRSLHPMLEGMGFIREESPMFRVGVAVEGGGERDWYYGAGDSDALYSPGL